MKFVVMFLFLFVSILFAQYKPFPQALSYDGCIKPTNFSQSQLNNYVSSYYDYWKKHF